MWITSITALTFPYLCCVKSKVLTTERVTPTLHNHPRRERVPKNLESGGSSYQSSIMDNTESQSIIEKEALELNNHKGPDNSSKIIKFKNFSFLFLLLCMGAGWLLLETKSRTLYLVKQPVLLS